MTRGFTLVELLTVAVITAITAIALTSALAASIRYHERAPELERIAQRRTNFEDRIRMLVRKAYVSSTATDTVTYFIGNTNGQDTSSLDNQQSADQIIFTVLGRRPSAGYLATQETDFAELNRNYGPEGGVAEISLSTVAVGDAGEQQGLFIREQKPSDGDPTQGGYESLLDDDIRSIGFEFYDGTSWQPQWDTTTESRRLPAAVRVTYTLLSEEEVTHVFIVNLPNSDVTINDPYDPNDTGDAGTTGGATGGTTGGTP